MMFPRGASDRIKTFTARIVRLFLQILTPGITRHRRGAGQISSTPSPGGEGRDEGEQLFPPQAPHYIGQKKSVVRPIASELKISI
jgi:hypothetical protein